MQGEVLTASKITATINDHGVLTGVVRSQSIACTISDAITIDGMISNTVQISADMSGAVGLSADITIPDQTGGVPYEGDYTVTPKAHEATILPTTGKTMTNDVTVIEIPYYETSNVSGSTVYIANEV